MRCRYADENKDNLELINRLIDKTDELKGLTHREAAVLLACEDKDALERIFAQATKIKQEFYGNRIVMFAPLYLSNYCVNGCVYCPYHYEKQAYCPQKADSGGDHAARLLLCRIWGTSGWRWKRAKIRSTIPLSIFWRASRPFTPSSTKNGAIRRVNVNIAATTVENYRKLKEAGIGTYILFQETYHKESYREAASHRPEAQLRLPHRGDGPCHGGRH